MAPQFINLAGMLRSSPIEIDTALRQRLSYPRLSRHQFRNCGLLLLGIPTYLGELATYVAGLFEPLQLGVHVALQ
jgi:hypothetical protein